LTPPASPEGELTEALLYSFSGGDGDGPTTLLAIGGDGVLYGTTEYGGSGDCTGFAGGCGVVFSLTPPTSPGGKWTEATVHNFSGIPDGAVPGGGVTIGAGGVLYGTTENGGDNDCGGNLGCGTVYAISPPTAAGGSWTEAAIYNFGDPARAIDGVDAEGKLALGAGGVLYGTTFYGGSGDGMVYSLTPPTSPGGSWTRTVLHSFPGPSEGNGGPYGGLAIDANGVLYGTAERGGGLWGAVFAVQP
jgi:hypothetical protein